MPRGAESESYVAGERMTRRTFTLLAAVLWVIGASVRVHNGLRFPVLSGYDGFAHFTYVWYLAATGRVPLPTAGWEFFQPPLYYALMAGFWRGLAGIEPIVRLHAGTAVIAAAGLVHAWVVWDVTRRRWPDDRLLRLTALAFMLFLPVHLYGVGFLGNEQLTAVWSSLAFVALLAEVRRPSLGRSLALGLLLGLALLTKITALAVVAGAVGTLVLRGAAARTRGLTAAHLVVVLGALVIVSGWYYARNVADYGTPFVMSRRELVLRIVEDDLPQARRTLAEYLLFDPLVFRRPMWPRGDAPPALRDAVWTGLYANTWYDGFGGWAVPRVTESETSRRAGQALLLLGIAPTLVVLLGFAASLSALRPRHFDGAKVATVTTLAPMLLIFVVGTREVPIAAAVKATYLMPVTAAFGVAFALGLAELRRRWPRALRVVAADVALVSVLSVVVFWHGLLFDARAIRGSFPMIEASLTNQLGVVAYAGGDRGAARGHFERAAADGLHLGDENLGILALEDGRLDEAVHHLKRALRVQPSQSLGLAADRAMHDRGTRAEYLNLLALVALAQDRPERAARVAGAAVRLDPTIPEAHYDLAVALLAAPPVGANGPASLTSARVAIERSLALDSAFREASALRDLLDAYRSACAGLTTMPSWRTSPPGTRRYPVETGPGASYAASIGRRRHAPGPPPWLREYRCPAPTKPVAQSQT